MYTYIQFFFVSEFNGIHFCSETKQNFQHAHIPFNSKGSKDLLISLQIASYLHQNTYGKLFIYDDRQDQYGCDFLHTKFLLFISFLEKCGFYAINCTIQIGVDSIKYLFILVNMIFKSFRTEKSKAHFKSSLEMTQYTDNFTSNILDWKSMKNLNLVIISI